MQFGAQKRGPGCGKLLGSDTIIVLNENMWQEVPLDPTWLTGNTETSPGTQVDFVDFFSVIKNSSSLLVLFPRTDVCSYYKWAL